MVSPTPAPTLPSCINMYRDISDQAVFILSSHDQKGEGW